MESVKNEHEGPGQGASSGRWVRLAWVVAVVAFSAPALFRIGSTPRDETSFLASIAVAIALTFAIGLGLLWLMTLYVSRREFFLGKAFPDCTLFHVAELGPGIVDFLTREGKSSGRHFRSLSVTVVILRNRLEFWSGGRKPSRIATVPKEQLRQVDSFKAHTGLRRARGVRLRTTSGQHLDFVPIERMGHPLRSSSVDSLLEELRAWSEA